VCVCGNLCTCVRVSTNLESPPTMGNFKVWLVSTPAENPSFKKYFFLFS
jgi:hypothetical protein